MNNTSRKACFLFLLLILPAACSPTTVPTPTSLPTTSPRPTELTAPLPTTGPTFPPTTTPSGPAPITPLPDAARFAAYSPEPVEVQPSVSHERIAPDLSNVVSPFLLSAAQRERLSQNGFEVAVGRISSLYAVVPIEGELVVAKGGVFAYYEFPWPLSDRLTDEKWREMLDTGQAPALPLWTATYRVDETEEFALRQGVQRFVDRWTSAAWNPSPGALEGIDTEQALERTPAYLQSLAEEGFYEGHFLVRLAYLSFDLKDAEHAIVTTRETWWSERYRAHSNADQAGTLTAVRPEHTLGVIYHLERVQEEWQVRQVLVEGNLPAWEEAGP